MGIANIYIYYICSSSLVHKFYHRRIYFYSYVLNIRGEVYSSLLVAVKGGFYGLATAFYKLTGFTIKRYSIMIITTLLSLWLFYGFSLGCIYDRHQFTVATSLAPDLTRPSTLCTRGFNSCKSLSTLLQVRCYKSHKMTHDKTQSGIRDIFTSVIKLSIKLNISQHLQTLQNQYLLLSEDNFIFIFLIFSKDTFIYSKC